MTADIEVTRRPYSTVYYAAELGIRTAEVVHEPEGWDIRCYYGPEDYDATVRSRRSREDAERVALAHSLAVIR
ncbi:MAG TPA: hypothetical protein VN635_09340 [Conexibacter sp.]|nr:hypothetical protein [Conexibacter sp.]